jgi:hypothetical protein
VVGDLRDNDNNDDDDVLVEVVVPVLKLCIIKVEGVVILDGDGSDELLVVKEERVLFAIESRMVDRRILFDIFLLLLVCLTNSKAIFFCTRMGYKENENVIVMITFTICLLLSIFDIYKCSQYLTVPNKNPTNVIFCYNFYAIFYLIF